MARTRTRTPAPIVPNGFVASAASLPTENQAQAGRVEGWQTDAWKFYDTVGELRYVSNWIGNVLSRGKLYAAKRVDNHLVPHSEPGPALDAMEALYGGPQGQSQMLQLTGTDLCVGGEAYVSARVKDNEDLWDVLATGKVTQTGSGDNRKITMNLGTGEERYEKTDNDLLIRIWTPHPRDPVLADAPTRSNLKTLGQIVGYDDHITAQLTSRLAGQGLLLLPSEIQFAAGSNTDPAATQASQILSVLFEAMTTAKTDIGGPASFVPIVMTAPGEFIDKATHLKFWSELDASVIEMRTAAIQRFAIGMDVPPEVLMGNGDSNHWNAWLSEESAIKAHLEPRLGVIAAALSSQYLRPSLKGQVPDAELKDWFVIADTSEIRTRPDRSAHALELHERGLLSDEATLREAGFADTDIMGPDAKKLWLLQRISTGAVTPEITMEALRMLGIDMPRIVLQDNGIQEPPDHTRTDTNVPDPDRVRPELDDVEDNIEPLVAACEVLVFRALERAGNRMKNREPALGEHPVHQTYLHASGDPVALLEGAWTCAHEVLAPYTKNPDLAVQTLDFYTGGLIASQTAHNPTTLKMLLRSWSETPLALSK